MMADKQIIINGVDVSRCDFYDKNKKYCLTLKMDTRGFKNPSCFSGDFQKCIQDSKVCLNTFCENNYNCYYKQLKRKEQECEELKEDRERWKSNFNGKVSAIEELLQQLDQLKAENEELRKSITKIFVCLIKANRDNKIVDTLWVENIITLWDYIAQTLGIEGDQTQIEEQILQ